MNDDIAIIGLSALSGNAEPENTGRVSYDLLSNIPVPSGVTLTVSTIAGSATEGDDYVPLDMVEVSFQAGAQVQSIPFVKRVIINDDDLFENDLETFFVVLSAPAGGLPPGVELDPTRLRYTVDIEDNEMATVVFDEASYEVNEDAGTVDVTFGFEDGVMLGDNLEVTVNYGIPQDAGTATAGEDYTLAAVNSVVLTALNRRETVSIPILDDDLFEGDETFAIALLGSSHRNLEATGKTEVTIKDNDSVTVDFIDGFGSQTLSEGDGPVIVKFGVTGDTTLAGTATVEVPYTTSSGTANDTVRYTSYYHDEDFTFESEVMSDDNKITFTDTGVEEIGFDFEYYGQVYTHYRYEGNGYIVLSNGGIEAARLALLPDKGDQNPNLELSSTAGPLASGLPIIAPFWDTFIAADPDTTGYEVLKEGDDGKYLIIQPSDGITDVEFNIQYQIVLFENTNQIEFRYRNVSALTMAENPTPSSYGASATIGIKDATGEFGTGEYIQLSYNAATLSNNSLIRFVPHIDYKPVAGTVILTADQPEATIEIPLVDDGITEGDEQFTFESLLFDSAGTITITDDDPGIIEIPLDLYKVEAHESDFATVGDPSTSGIANLRVRTDPPLVEPFTLNYVIEFGSASADDLLATPMTGEWELVENVRLHDFLIDINNDDDPESVENFFVDLSIPDGTSLPPGYSILPGRSEVTIADNDLKLVGFDRLEGPTENTKNRNFASAGLAIGPSGEDFLGVTITLHYEIENGTAIEGEDYVPARVDDPDAAQPNFIPTPGKLTGTVTISPPPPDPFGGPGLVRPGDNYIPILVIYDDIVENNETYTVRLFEPPEGLPSGFELYRDTVELTIFNDDPVKIGFEAPVVTVNENETAELSVAITSTIQIDEDWELTIGYRVSEDSALSGHDYLATDGTLTFSANMTQATIRIPIIDDDIFEGANSERFVVTLFDPAPFRVVPWLSFEPMEAEVMIVDNDAPEIRLLPENARVREDVTPDMTLRATIPYTLTVDLELTLARFHDDDDATVNEDFGTYQVPDTVTIPAGDTEVVIEATVTDDIIAEVEKVLLVGVTHLNHAGLAQPYEYPLAGRPSAAVTIVHDDTLNLNIEASENVPGNVGDTDYSYQVCVTFSNPLEYVSVGRPQTLMLEIRVRNSDGTPGELYPGEIIGYDGQSYIGVPVPFTPIEGDTQGCVELEFENEYYEGQRIYDINLLGHPGLAESIQLGDVSSKVTVAENEAPALALNYGGNREVAEGQGIDVELELTNGAPEGLHEPLTVRLALTTTSSASTSDIDFPSTVTIPRGMSSATFRIEARNDMLDGEIEQFELALVSTTPATAAGTTVAFSSGGAIAVTEAPVPQVTLSVFSNSVQEGETVLLTARLTEELTGGVPEPLTVELTVEGVTPGADSGDYTYSPMYEIVIPTGQSMGIVGIIVTEDAFAEFDELFKISVARLGYGSNRSAPTEESSVEVTIRNNDRITATITASDVTEAVDAIVMVTIELDRALPNVPGGLAADDVKLVVRNQKRRADFGGLDANGALNLVDLFGGGTRAVVPLSVVDDMILEGTEQGRLTVEGSPRLNPLFIDVDSSKDIYAEVRFDIMDNEPTTVRLVAWDPVSNTEITTITEFGVFDLFAELAPGVTADDDIIVKYTYDFEGTDENGNVRIPLSCAELAKCPLAPERSITIRDGENRSSDFDDIGILQNDIVEETKLFQLVLTSAGSPATVGTPLHITVLDNDTLTYEIEGAAAIDEDAGSYTVQLRRKGTITADAMVAYTVSGGDVSTADFAGNAFPSGNFTFNGYDALSDEVTFTIENDGDSEGAETFQISVNGGTTTTTKSKEVTINDDDATLVTVRRGGSDSGPVAEGGMIMLEATLADGTLATENLMVTVAARARVSDPDGGTAADVNLPSPPTVMIAMGTSIATFTVSADNDNDAEYDETVNIYVTHVGVDEIMDDGYDLTIASDDDDKITVTSLEVLSTSTLTEGGTANVRITLSGMLPDRTPANSLSLVLSDGSTVNPDVAIQARDIVSDLKAANSVDVMVTLNHDDLLEDAEQIDLELRINSGNPNLADVLDVSGASTSFMLADADMGQVSIAALSKTSYNENEDVMVTVELPSGLTAGANITVNYELIVTTTNEDDKASAADIVGVTSDSVTINENAGMAIITIDLNDDSVAEFTEQLGIRLTSASGATGVTFDNAITNVMILDDETLAYSFEGTGKVSEKNTAYTVQLKRVGRLPDGGGATVPFTVSGGSGRAAVAADFAADALPTGNFVFTGYAAESAEVTLPAVKDDGDIEGDETFQITLTGRTETHDVTLADNDVPVIDIERVSGSGPVAEGASVQFRARLDNGTMSGATEDLTVNLSLGLTSTVFADDVSFLVNGVMTSTVTIPMGMTERAFMVIVKDDELAEFAEQVRIVAQSVETALLGNNLNSGRGYDLEIETNDLIDDVKIDVDDTIEGGMARVRITLNRLLPDRTPNGALSLVLLSGGTTNADVRIISKDITTELETSLTTDVMIELINNPLLDGNRTVQVMLRIEPGMSPDLATLLPNLPTASFEIIDDERPEVSIVPPPDDKYYESEGGHNGRPTMVVFEFKLPEGVIAANPIKVYYSMGIAEIGSGSETAYGPLLVPGFAQGVALPARGFAQVPRLFVTILPGENSVTLTVTLPDDDKAEVTELLTVRLDDVEATGVPQARVDQSMGQTVITILDDEDPVLEIIGSGEIDEDDGGYMVQLRRLGRINQDGKIPYTIVGQGANEGDFVGALTGEFEFDGYEPVSKQVILILNDDNSEEESKPFQISVENPMTKAYASVPIVDPVTGMVFTSIMLIDSDVAGLLGDLPPTGGPVLPVWLILLLALTGVALLVPTLKLNR